MFRRLFTVLTLAAAHVASQVCFTQQQVQTSTALFTYQGNVYDITNYNHPGGATKLNLVIGGALEDFVNLPQYSFHLTKARFNTDLARLLVGPVCGGIPTVAPVGTTVAPVGTTVAPVGTTVSPVVTTTKCTTSTRTTTAATNDASSSSASTNEIYLYYVITGILAVTMLVN